MLELQTDRSLSQRQVLYETHEPLDDRMKTTAVNLLSYLSSRRMENLVSKGSAWTVVLLLTACCLR